MKVDYELEARSLNFEFRDVREPEDGDYVEELAGGMCIVWFRDDRPFSIQLLGADSYLDSLDEAAQRFDLDAEALRAGAQAAFAAPDREIIIEVGIKLPTSYKEKPEEARAA